MPSTFPAFFSSGTEVPVTELNPSFTPWDDFSPLFNPNPTILPKPGSSKPPINFYSLSGSVPNRNQENNPNEPVSIMEERKRKRKLSNRDSARRSRMRKLNHVESLVRHVTRLKSENRGLTNRFRIVNHNLLFTRTENQQLLDECVALRRRLTRTNQTLHLMQIQPYHSMQH